MTGRPINQTSGSSLLERLLRKNGLLKEDLDYKLNAKMKKITDFFSGKKTYIGTAIVFVAGGLLAIKAIDQRTFETIVAIGGAIAVYGLRSAIRKLEN
jgi:predicted thioredoxin/glutaredoxin